MASSAEQQQWIESYLKGDASGFERIMAFYEPPVLRYLWRLTGNRGTAEDLCQETFFKVLGNLSKLRDRSGLKPWIFKIAHRAAMDYFRKNKVETHSMDRTDEDGIELPDAGNDPLRHIVEDQLRDAVDRAMDRLTPHQKEILHLYYWEELSVAEIAASLKVPDGTVKTHLFRGRKALRRRLVSDLREKLA
jgi:RNA polymerase sigma-70 factor (ECF subfamily)